MPNSLPKPTRRRSTFLVLMIVFSLLAVGAYWYWQAFFPLNKSASPPQTEQSEVRSTRASTSPSPNAGGGRGARMPIPVTTERARVGNVPITIDALGTTVAHQQAIVQVRVDGLLESTHFNEGAMVKAGDILARIDPRPFEATVAVARGQLLKNQAQLELAKLDLERYRQLLTQDSIARQQVDAQAALVAQLEGVVASDEGTLKNAQLNLSFTQVVAPLTGRTGLRQIDPGNMVRSTNTNGLVTITQTQPISVALSVSQDQLNIIAQHFRPNAQPYQAGFIPALLMDKDVKTVLGEGHLWAIDNQADPVTGNTKVKVIAKNEKNLLFPGQFTNVRLTVKTIQQTLIIPQSAVQRGAPGIFVYRVNAEKIARVQPIKLGPTVPGDLVIVEQGLEEGDTVVIDGSDKLRDGTPVTAIMVNPPPHPRKNR